MRKKTKTTGLVSHATPDSSLYMGERDKLVRKFNQGNITEEELRKLSFFTLQEKKSSKNTPEDKSTMVIVMFIGKTIRIPRDIAEKAGYTIIKDAY